MVESETAGRYYLQSLRLANIGKNKEKLAETINQYEESVVKEDVEDNYEMAEQINEFEMYIEDVN